LRLSVLSSGSSGNATYMETESGGLLVDAGLQPRRIGALLARVGRSLADVNAVLLTHGHADHTCGIAALVRERKIEVYAAPGVGESLGANTVAPGEPCSVKDLGVTFFEVPHDSMTYGVRVSDGSSVDPDWLRRGPYSASLKRRISSRRGHLSNRQAADAAVVLAPQGLKDLVLAHLSKTNNSPTRACGTVDRALREAGHGGVRVRAALAGRPTPWIEVGVPLRVPEHVYRYGERDAAGQLFGIE
jgi:phosphoribosyl 1,2-cyclic phosphodiesterase